MRELSAAAKDCPLAPPARASVYARTLHRACLILGGLEQLAKHLEISDLELLRRCLGGQEQPSERVFHASLEIVLLHAESDGKTN